MSALPPLALTLDEMGVIGNMIYWLILKENGRLCTHQILTKHNTSIKK
jgi:hypothetical protein